MALKYYLGAYFMAYITSTLVLSNCTQGEVGNCEPAVHYHIRLHLKLSTGTATADTHFEGFSYG